MFGLIRLAGSAVQKDPVGELRPARAGDERLQESHRTFDAPLVQVGTALDLRSVVPGGSFVQFVFVVRFKGPGLQRFLRSLRLELAKDYPARSRRLSSEIHLAYRR
jgi:hypothetical protein